MFLHFPHWTTLDPYWTPIGTIHNSVWIHTKRFGPIMARPSIGQLHFNISRICRPYVCSIIFASLHPQSPSLPSGSRIFDLGVLGWWVLSEKWAWKNHRLEGIRMLIACFLDSYEAVPRSRNHRWQPRKTHGKRLNKHISNKITIIDLLVNQVWLVWGS